MTATPQHRATGAFTLTEVLMVMVILGILAAFASPLAYRRAGQPEVDAVAERVAGDLEIGLGLAIRHGRVLEFSATDEGSYTIRDAGPAPLDSIRLRGEVDHPATGGAPTLEYSAATIRLLPSGRASDEFRVRISDGSATRTVVLRPEGLVELQ